MALVGPREAAEVIHLSKRTQRLERRWVVAAKADIDKTTRRVLANARQTGRIKESLVDFEPLMMKHAFETMKLGFESTERRQPIRNTYLASPPPGTIPKSLRALRAWYFEYRKTGKAGARQKVLAARLKAAYLEKLSEVWRELSDDFLQGNTFDQEEVIAAIARRANVTKARAKTIVETETTKYFNAARRAVYDASPEVSHYLYVAIRDHVTTKWCKTRQGLVYAKGDPLLDKETPPVHWNCRSELLPLTPHNPAHLVLIQDRARSRRHNSPEPLPVGWTGRTKAS